MFVVQFPKEKMAVIRQVAFRLFVVLFAAALSLATVAVGRGGPRDEPRCKGNKEPHKGKCLYPDEIKRLKAKEKATSGKSKSRAKRKKKGSSLASGMVELPGGTFSIGCNRAGDDSCLPGESPRHKVELGAFFIDRHEVTVEDYAKCVNAGVCGPPDDASKVGECNWGSKSRQSHPVNCVDWNQARTYCEWQGKRLPTEAEWERAASDGTVRRFPWTGKTAHCLFAVMNHVSWGCGKNRTWPVCSKTQGSTRTGLCDMAGNVSEWTQDFFSETFYVNSPTKDPMDGRDSGYRVRRGGAWTDTEALLRVSSRQRSRPDSRLHFVGFRCVKSK